MSLFKNFIYGGDYSPNQWDEETVERDTTYFQEANLNSATLNVFSWAEIQPSEHVYDFKALERDIDLLAKKNIRTVLATSTAALPAWLYRDYPDVARVDHAGRRHVFGFRHNACPNSPNYLRFMTALVEKQAQRYAGNPNIQCWHVNNEYGGDCYCDNCTKAFRVWVRDKYKTIAAVNKAWNMAFWGHTLYQWDEIVLPNELSEETAQETTVFAGISIDYKRFFSDSMLATYLIERDIIKKYDPNAIVTTNLMGTYKNLDYFKFAKEMDVISWDNYPALDTPISLTAMTHDLMRSLKKMPFMLMEQTPSQTNWQPYNALKKPGQLMAQSIQAVAHGANTIQYFQLKQSVGANEKFHGAVIDHVGHNDTRVYREVKAIGDMVANLPLDLLESNTVAKVGIFFDWANYWALEYTSGPTQDLKYIEQIHHYYTYFYQKNMAVDFLTFDDDLSKYDVIVAPVLYMTTPELVANIDSFVKNGGTFVTSFMSGIVDQSDNVILGGYPGPFRKMAGIWVEEFDALAPDARNSVVFSDHSVFQTRLLCDVIHLEGAESLATYGSDFYQDTPAITKNNYGKGQVVYFGSMVEYAGLEKVFETLFDNVSETELEVSVRESEQARYLFILNLLAKEIALPPEYVGQTNLVNQEKLQVGKILKPYETIILVQV
ncbi:beta-galactosidase LacZ [Lactococcus hodotermopsidis]|uniref:Beta-galactosidase n=1 Tax=Pseudolactococcus hodotermopsidis TaxID=2709157 RepID=A0A6A0BDI1_9LACT|nr:beta-galactosidase [Lactococcus hodotermopsidis]GFH42725.1 beta-galactosidase LacZ [Lactococcus hodotermopsidis]